MNTWNALIVAFVITAAVSDAYTRKIPRLLTMSGVVAGIAFHLFAGGIISSLAAMVIGFALALTFFHLGAIGGGDVKLIAALGSMLGMYRWMLAMEVAVFAAAIMGVIQVGRSGALVRTFSNIGEIASGIAKHGFKPHPVVNVQNSHVLRSPFGVAAALGTLLAVAVR